MVEASWICFAAVWGYFDIMSGNMTASAFALIIFFILKNGTYLDKIAYIYTALVEDYAGVKRLINNMATKQTIADQENAKPLDVKHGGIKIEDLAFSYSDSVSVFKKLDVEIKGKQKIGLLGSSGAGKTSLVKLLARFYDPNIGSIQIDGQNIQDVTLYSLREAVGVIPQDIALFNHPIIENIRYGRLEASDEEVMEAAKKAHAHEFIMSLPNGYDTMVGERGVKLSGGQRQRIAIARAILKDAPILILDEATSALDSESEKLIQESLKELMEGKTVIAIAHRLSTISHLDRLIVMDQGQIAEDGTHEELLANKQGLYAKLWTMQSGRILG